MDSSSAGTRSRPPAGRHLPSLGKAQRSSASTLVPSPHSRCCCRSQLPRTQSARTPATPPLPFSTTNRKGERLPTTCLFGADTRRRLTLPNEILYGNGLESIETVASPWFSGRYVASRQQWQNGDSC